MALVKLNKAYENVLVVPEVVFNLPTASMWEQVDTIAPYTAKNPVPAQKADKYTFAQDKFAIGGFTPHLRRRCVRRVLLSALYKPKPK